jgi:hypothetical protein
MVPAFFGLGVVWRLDAPWADAVARVIDPWDSNPILARLEANRVYHLAKEYSRRREIHALTLKNLELTTFLEQLTNTRVFKLAERLARVRSRGRSESWSDAAERVVHRDGNGS